MAVEEVVRIRTMLGYVGLHEKVPKGAKVLQVVVASVEFSVGGLSTTLPVSLASSLKSLVTLSFSVTAELERESQTHSVLNAL